MRSIFYVLGGFLLFIFGLTVGLLLSTPNFNTTSLLNNQIKELKNIPDGAVYYNGHHYFIEKADSWEEAVEKSEETNSHLATISNNEENDFLYDYIVTNGVDSAYFGLTDQEKEGEWKWVTDEPFDYSNWADGEPSNDNYYGSDGEDYGMFYYKFYKEWNDGDFKQGTQNDPGYYILEWDY